MQNNDKIVLLKDTPFQSIAAWLVKRNSESATNRNHFNQFQSGNKNIAENPKTQQFDLDSLNRDIYIIRKIFDQIIIKAIFYRIYIDNI